jgi:hypothetical protein
MPHILSNHVGFNMHAIANFQIAECGMMESVVDDRQLEHPFTRQLIDGETHTINTHGPVWDHELEEIERKLDVNQDGVVLSANRANGTNIVYMPLYNVSPQTIAGTQRSFQIDPATHDPVGERRAAQSGHDRRGGEPSGAELANREASAIQRDALARDEIIVFAMHAKLEPRVRGRDLLDGPNVVNQSGKHSNSVQGIGRHEIIAQRHSAENPQMGRLGDRS